MFINEIIIIIIIIITVLLYQYGTLEGSNLLKRSPTSPTSVKQYGLKARENKAECQMQHNWKTIPGLSTSHREGVVR